MLASKLCFERSDKIRERRTTQRQLADAVNDHSNSSSVFTAAPLAKGISWNPAALFAWEIPDTVRSDYTRSRATPLLERLKTGEMPSRTLNVESCETPDFMEALLVPRI